MSSVIIFRSADENAEDDARAIRSLLDNAGIAAQLLDDSAPGVPEGAWEVRVDASNSARADALVATQPLGPAPDDSSDLDMVTVFRSGGTDTESEAMTVKGLLEAAGLEAEMIGDVRFPNFSQHVQVPRAQAAEARQLILEALASGPKAAEEGEAQTEGC